MSNQKTIEVEFRSLFDEATFTRLNEFLGNNAEDLGADDKRVWFFPMDRMFLKVAHNVSRKNGKVALKLHQKTHGATEEIEFRLEESDVPKAVRLFEALGHEYLLEPTILRHDYHYKGVDIAVKYSKSWGYHAELEIMVEQESEHAGAEELIRAVAGELDLKIMTEQEHADFTGAIKANYVHPPEVFERPDAA